MSDTRDKLARRRSAGSVGSDGGRRARGMILLTCMIVITLGALVGTTILYFSGAQRQAAEVAFRSVQARAMAWSGVQAAMAELAAGREGLLRGQRVAVSMTWTAEMDEATHSTSHVRWGYRVMRVRRASMEAEMGKLDVNTASAEMLARLSGVSKELAAAIVTARTSRRLASVPELLAVPGMSAELLFGAPATTGAEPAEAEPGAGAGGEAARSEGDDGAAATSRPADKATDARDEGVIVRRRPLAEYLTVFSFDPEVQIGFGSKASEVAGNQRINLNAVWSDALGDAIEKRFDKGVADGVKGLMERGEKFARASDIVKKLRAFNIEPKDWVEVLDAFTTTADEYRLGMIDLSTASEEVLACVPGITKDSAHEIAFRRERLDEDRRLTVVWPVLEGLLTPDAFEKAVDHLTTRCMQWKVVVEGGALPRLTGSLQDAAAGGAGEQPGLLEDDGDSIGGERTGAGASPSLPAASVLDRVVLEAVIDVSARRPRVAMLRDVTNLPLATKLADVSRRAAAAAQEHGSGAADEARQPPEPDRRSDAGQPGPSGHELDVPDLSPSGLSFDDDEGGPATSGPLDEEPEPAPGTTAGNGASEPPPAGRDRRLGRWSTGGTGGQR